MNMVVLVLIGLSLWELRKSGNSRVSKTVFVIVLVLSTVYLVSYELGKLAYFLGN